jgi:hypothetical protein
MAKTTFAHGTIVSSEFLNTMYKTGGGHVHDGADSDGHAGKIDLVSHTSGKISLDTQTSGKIDLETQVRGVLPVANGGGSAAGVLTHIHSEPIVYHRTRNADDEVRFYLLQTPENHSPYNLAVISVPYFEFSLLEQYADIFTTDGYEAMLPPPPAPGGEGPNAPVTPAHPIYFWAAGLPTASKPALLPDSNPVSSFLCILKGNTRHFSLVFTRHGGNMYDNIGVSPVTIFYPVAKIA